MYHRVLAHKDPLQPDYPDQAQFAQQMRWLSGCFQIVPLPHAITALKTGTLSARTACITFDDGYADNIIYALPILQRYQLPATVFIATDFLNGGRMFNDTVTELIRRAANQTQSIADLDPDNPVLSLQDQASRRAAIHTLLARIKYLSPADRHRIIKELATRLQVDEADLPDDLMMTTEQVRQLHHSGIDIGAHTVKHPILATLSDDAARTEIAQSQHTLETMLETAIQVFAYPNGQPGIDYLARDAAFVQQLGFIGAVTTAWGVAKIDTDPFQIPRFSPWRHYRLGFQGQLLQNLTRQPSLVE
jgi:peptidoglycan/xylan/chitin deacetylase (PgdA/CDA1 family)